MPKPEKQPVTIRGVLYESQKAAAAALGVTPSGIWWHLEAGTIDNAGSGRNTKPKPVIIKGVKYKSILAAARILHVSRDTIKKQLNDKKSKTRYG